MTMNSSEKKLTHKDLMGIFWRSFRQDAVWNFERQQNLGSAYTMSRVVGKLYEDDKEKRARALQRHVDFMAITPHLSTLLYGILAAMEEENAKSDTFDTSSINNVKVGLMGPMSGIGDSFFWGTFRVIAAGIGIGLAKSGNILGAVIYFLLYTAIHFITKILGGKYGYKMGTKFLENSEENHLMDKLSMGASILGMTVIGAMIGTMVSLQTTLSFTLAGTETTLQSIFDQIFPGILPLGATFLCVALFNKNVKTIYIIIGIFVLCILGCAIGIF